MKRSDKNKGEDIWKEVNSLTKHVTGNKVSSSQVIKRWFTSTIVAFCILVLLISTFLIGLVMQSAFNTNEFDQKLPEESIVVDMNKVDIHASDESLRLSYFKEETIEQAVVLLPKLWPNFFLTIDKNNFDFTFYSKDGTKDIDNSLVQKDGFVQCSLKVKLKSLPFQFKLPVIAQITNTAKFYEKFMVFNHFEYSYENHINGYDPPNAPFINAERKYHGYLNHNYHFPAGTAVDNTTIYQSINEQIADFKADYSEEFSDNTEIHPIITTVDLGDLDLNDPKTFLPFLSLIGSPNTIYVGNATIGSINEHVNLLDYTKSDPVSKNLKPFYIFYISNPNVINDLILNPPTTTEEIVSYFMNNPIDYLPFSHTQEGIDNTNTLITYSPSHFLTFETVTGTYFQYEELDFFLTNVQSIKNDIENIKSTNFATVGDLTTFLSNKFWEAIRQFLISNSGYINLKYPNPSDVEGNWTNATSSVLGLQAYFVSILGITSDKLTSIQYLDEKHQDLALDADRSINLQEIKNFNFNIGPKLIAVNDIIPHTHSLTYFFKTNWT